MASIDRHQYSEEIRKGAAKFVKDLNLDTKSPAYIPRKGVNGDSGMLKKVSNNLSSKLEYFQKLDKESVSSSFSLPRRSSAGSPATTNLIKNTSHINGEKSQEMTHLNGSLLTKTNGHGPELNGDQRLKNRSSIGAIASFALGDTASHSVDTKLQAGLEAQISFSKAVSSKEAGTKVTPLSRLPGQNLNIGELVTSVAVTQGVHPAQVAMITNNTNGLNGVVFSRQSSVEKVTLGMICGSNVNISTFSGHPKCQAADTAADGRHEEAERGAGEVCGEDAVPARQLPQHRDQQQPPDLREHRDLHRRSAWHSLVIIHSIVCTFTGLPGAGCSVEYLGQVTPDTSPELHLAKAFSGLPR